VTEISKSTGSGISRPRDIIASAQQHVLDLYNSKSGSKLLFHNYQRASELVKIVDTIGTESKYSSEVKEVAKLAAWFHGTGCLDDYDNFENRSVARARAFLKARSYSESKMNRVLAAINASKHEANQRGTEDQVLSDAVTAYDMTRDFISQSPLMRLERELVLDEKSTTSNWEQTQLKKLLDAKLYTPYSKVYFEPTLAQNILTQKNIVEKGRAKALQRGEDDEENNLRKFQDIEKKVPRSGIQTFFRTTYRNHINLSMIADQKANIMISVNAILISLLISILTIKADILLTSPIVLFPVVTFLMTGLTSLVFAILSIRPKVTNLNTAKLTKEENKKNVIFFGNFVHMNLEEYEEAMDAMFRDGELMYGNMTRDLYHLGKVLDKKYRYLTNAYNIFMVGFVATVLTFLVTLFAN